MSDRFQVKLSGMSSRVRSRGSVGVSVAIPQF
jgi:hypothetical protein